MPAMKLIGKVYNLVRRRGREADVQGVSPRVNKRTSAYSEERCHVEVLTVQIWRRW
jgi:hypothetical protein